MLRLRLQSLTILRAGLLTAVCAVALGCGTAQAQLATDTDPLAPKLQNDPRKQTPRFQKFGPQEQVQLGPSTPNFAPVPSGTGNTGFDATNTRGKLKAQAKTSKPKSAARNAPSGAPSTAGTAAPAPVAISPYQKPFPATVNSAFASAPGAPPVELGPIRRPLKKKRVEEDDPYSQLGIQNGLFTWYPAVELIGGYDTNPAQSNGSARGATLYTVAPELRARSNWSRHELKADLRGSFTGYSPDSEPTLSRPNGNAKIDGRIDVTRDTRIDLGGRLLVSTDNPGSPNLQAGLAKLPIYMVYGGSAGIGQKFNRFDISLKGDAQRTVYQKSELTDGTSESNDDRNYNQFGVALRGGYELTPGVTPFVEARTDTRKHDLDTDLSGYQRDSKGVTIQAGSSFELSRLLTGEIAAGYTWRDYKDPRLDKLSGFVGNASLIWSVNALTTAKFTAASSIEESTVAGVSGVVTRDFGLQVDHAFRRWLIGTAKFGFGIDSYKGSDISGTGATLCDCVVSTPGGTAADREDKRYSAGLGLTYKLNRMAQVKGEFRQEWLRSNVTGNDYTASIFLLGLRLQK